MQSFLRAFKLIVSILALSYVLDKLIYMVLSQVDQRTMTGLTGGKFNRYIALKDSLDIVFIGNSRANHHFDPEVFPGRGFNAGFDERNLAFSWAMIKLLPKNRPQTILINIDTWNLYHIDYQAEDLRTLAHKARTYPLLREELEAVHLYGPIQRFYWSSSFNGKALGLLKNYLAPKREDVENENGYEPLRLTEAQRKKRQLAFALQPNAPCLYEKEHLQVNPLALHYLHQIDSFGQMHNKRILFITPPRLNDTCRLARHQMQQVMDSLSLTYIDLTNLFDDDPNPELWQDVTHLAEPGARRFSIHVTQQLDILNQRQK